MHVFAWLFSTRDFGLKADWSALTGTGPYDSIDPYKWTMASANADILFGVWQHLLSRGRSAVAEVGNCFGRQHCKPQTHSMLC